MATPVEVIRRYQATKSLIRTHLERVATALWDAMDDHRVADMERLVDALVPQVLAGEKHIAQLTDAYLSAMLQQTAQGVDAATTTGVALRGVDPVDVYRRPVHQVWTEVSGGKPYPAAVQAGRRRLVSLILTDLVLAQRVQEQVTLSRGGMTFYRRVLTGRENCALCIVASTQRYRVGDLKAIHPACDCDVAPLRADHDPGQVLNDQTLNELHGQLDLELGSSDRGARVLLDRQGREVDYRDVLVRNHGEFGPTLTWRSDAFTQL